jgi:hypothetical protein
VVTLKQTLLYDWPRRRLGGHVSFTLFGHKVTVYGFNAMWLTIQVATHRWGYICFRPPTWNPKLRWKFYVSPNATPSIATFLIGSGVSKKEKRRATLRRQWLGHNFPVSDYDYQALLEIDYFDEIGVSKTMGKSEQSA